MPLRLEFATLHLSWQYIFWKLTNVRKATSARTFWSVAEKPLTWRYPVWYLLVAEVCRDQLLTAGQSPPEIRAAWSCCTLLSRSCTVEQSAHNYCHSAAFGSNLLENAAEWHRCSCLEVLCQEKMRPQQRGVCLHRSPQVVTNPSANIAANARSVAWSCCTLLSRSCTVEQSAHNYCHSAAFGSNLLENAAEWHRCSCLEVLCQEKMRPQQRGVRLHRSPQVVTNPSANIAANARSLAWSCCTLLSRSCMILHCGTVCTQQLLSPRCTRQQPAATCREMTPLELSVRPLPRRFSKRN